MPITVQYGADPNVVASMAEDTGQLEGQAVIAQQQRLLDRQAALQRMQTQRMLEQQDAIAQRQMEKQAQIDAAKDARMQAALQSKTDRETAAQKAILDRQTAAQNEQWKRQQDAEAAKQAFFDHQQQLKQEQLRQQQELEAKAQWIGQGASGFGEQLNAARNKMVDILSNPKWASGQERQLALQRAAEDHAAVKAQMDTVWDTMQPGEKLRYHKGVAPEQPTIWTDPDTGTKLLQTPTGWQPLKTEKSEKDSTYHDGLSLALKALEANNNNPNATPLSLSDMMTQAHEQAQRLVHMKRLTEAAMSAHNDPVTRRAAEGELRALQEKDKDGARKYTDEEAHTIGAMIHAGADFDAAARWATSDHSAPKLTAPPEETMPVAPPVQDRTGGVQPAGETQAPPPVVAPSFGGGFAAPQAPAVQVQPVGQVQSAPVSSPIQVGEVARILQAGMEAKARGDHAEVERLTDEYRRLRTGQAPARPAQVAAPAIQAYVAPAPGAIVKGDLGSQGQPGEVGDEDGGDNAIPFGVDVVEKAKQQMDDEDQSRRLEELDKAENQKHDMEARQGAAEMLNIDWVAFAKSLGISVPQARKEYMGSETVRKLAKRLFWKKE